MLNSDFIQESIQSRLLEDDVFSTESNKYHFNLLSMYFGDDYKVNDKITIRQPSVQDFIDAEDSSKIFDVITPFVTNTTSCRAFLWKMGIDWNKMSNYELFSHLISGVDYKYSKLIFGDIDFSTFNLLALETEDGNVKPTLYSHALDILLDEETVDKMSRYIQTLFYSFPREEEFVSNKTLKMDLINKDLEEMAARKKEQEGQKSKDSLLSMISFYLNHPGCQYTKEQLREVKYFEFMYNIQRLLIYEDTKATLNGAHSGFIDVKTIKQNDLNFMREIKGFA